MIKKAVVAKVGRAVVAMVGVVVLLLAADHQLTAVEVGVIEAEAAPFEVGFMPSEFLGGDCLGIAGCDWGGTEICCKDDTCGPGTYDEQTVVE